MASPLHPGSDWREHVYDAACDQRLGFCPIGGHVRRSRMRLERLGACPFLDHDEGIRSKRGLESTEASGVDRSTVFDAALLRPDTRNIGLKCFEHALPLAWIGGDNGENMNHEAHLPLGIR